MQGNEDKETSMDKVQSAIEYKKKKSRWGRRDFPHLSKSVLRPTQLPKQREPGLFPGG